VPVEPPFSLPERFSDSGERVMDEVWWAGLADEELDALLREALERNFSLRGAWSRLVQARAQAAKAGAGLYPTLSGSGGAEREAVHASGNGREYATAFDLGLSVSYEIDLWGRVRAARDAAALTAMAGEEDLRSAALSLSALVARTWFTAVEERLQLALIRSQIKTNESLLAVTTEQFRRGLASAADVLQQRQLVEAGRGDETLGRASLKTLENQLAILLGRTPGAFALGSDPELPTPPALPATGVPAELVQRRPDLRAAQMRVQAADRSAAAALAERFPRIAIGGRAGTGSDQVKDLFDNWVAALAANLTAPLLDGGLRRAEVERARAVADEALHGYAQAVLNALGEVEDALDQERAQADYLSSLQAQLTLSEQALDQVRETYVRSGTGFERYLSARLSQEQLQRSILRARRALLNQRVALHLALGGPCPAAAAGADGTPTGLDNTEQP
jgi:NodT family efflux transporter outer membrane factor (OMF) lipoprotein